MKIFVILLVLSVAILASPIINEESDFGKVSNELRVTSGENTKKGENLDYCYIVVNFYNVQKTCGCNIISPIFVTTSARCVFDCSEKLATNVTVFFPLKSGKDATRSVEQIFIPDGTNGDANVEAYDPTMDTPYTTISINNIGLIKLANSITIDDKTASSYEYVSGDSLAEFFSDFLTPQTKFRGCGFGWVNNKGEKAKGMTCTELNLVPTGQCKKLGTTEFLTQPEGIACFQWANKDNNMCVGDYGSSIYAYEVDPVTGESSTQEIMCIAIGSPDVRANAPCQDGHTIYCEFWSTPLVDWVNSIKAQFESRKASTVKKNKTHIK